MKTKALIFDLDGVITDTARFHYLAWRALCDEENLRFNEYDNERLKGVSRARSFEIILEINGVADSYNASRRAECADRKNALYVEHIKTLTPADILPGVSALINDAKAHGLKTAVASVSKNAKAVLASLGLLDKFDYIADAAKVERSKPAPDIFLACSDALGIEAGSCTGIEDAQAGIEAIKAAGMFAVGINVTVTSTPPDLALKSTSELTLAKVTI